MIKDYHGELCDTSLRVMQSTGLVDRNNTEIYEGDIILTDFSPYPWLFTVEWDDEIAGFVENDICGFQESLNGHSDLNTFFVVGNIYEDKIEDLMADLEKTTFGRFCGFED